MDNETFRATSSPDIISCCFKGAGEVSSRVLGGWGLSHVPGTMRPKGKGPLVVAPESAAGRRVPRLATGKLGASSSVFPYKPFKTKSQDFALMLGKSVFPGEFSEAHGKEGVGPGRALHGGNQHLGFLLFLQRGWVLVPAPGAGGGGRSMAVTWETSL